MNVLYWNCRRLGNVQTQRALFNFCRVHKPDYLCIAEPMVLFDNMPSSFWRALDFSFLFANDLDIPTLWVLVSNKISAKNAEIFTSSTQYITVQFHRASSVHFLTFIYASVRSSVRRLFWSELNYICSNISSSWFLADFNSCFGSHEKTGQPPSTISC